MKLAICRLAIAVAVSCATVACSKSAHADTWKECRAKNTCTIEYDHLADQESEPFMLSGRVVDRENTRWRSLRHAIYRYRSVRDCLAVSERAKQTPNLLKIDWDAVGFGKGAQVCIFRIARSLADVDRLHGWFEYHGFQVVGPHASFGGNHKPDFKSEPTQSMAATWTEDQFKEHKGFFFRAFTRLYPVSGYAINLWLAGDDRVVSVSTSWIAK